MSALRLHNTPSLLNNNLTVANDTVAYIHKKDVVVLKQDGSQTRHVSLSGPINIKYVSVDGNSWLVCAGYQSVQVYDATELTKVFTYSLPAAEEKEISLCTSGITTIFDGTQHALVIGTYEGKFLIVNVDKFKFHHEKTLDTPHNTLITDLSSQQETSASAHGTHAVSGDLAGNVVVWETKAGDLSSVAVFQNVGNTVTGVRIRNNLVIASFFTGHVRLYDFQGCGLAAEIAAHSRCITSIDLHPTSLLLATAGEDTCVHVWDLNKVDRQEISVTKSERVPDHQFVGVKFLPGAGNRILALAFDNEVGTFINF